MQQALLVSPDRTAAALSRAVIDISVDSRGRRELKGQGVIRNVLLVQLLENHDDLDLLLDLGGEFKYLLENPQLSGGKVFAPDVRATVQFAPSSPWRQLSQQDFQQRSAALTMLADEKG